MATFPFTQVDAFTKTPLGGNACAVFFDTDELDAPTMLAIAREMNLSESAFVRSSQIADFGVRFFTPAEEIPLAGHPTIATSHALIDSGRVELTGDKTTITLELQVGPIRVDIDARDNDIEQIVMTQMKPMFMETYEAGVVMPIFRLSPKDVLPNAPIQTVSTGTPQLMIPVRDLEVLRRIQVDVPAYEEFRLKADFFSPHLFCLQGITDRGLTFARHFGVPPDTPEDPVTGSATGGMAAYLWHYGFITESQFIAEQGHWMNRPGYVFVEVIGPRQEIESIKIGGTAVTVMQGTLSI
jgi:trans-2,3-dihydro-3-hydroxyanthranilate isomerase